MGVVHDNDIKLIYLWLDSAYIMLPCDLILITSVWLTINYSLLIYTLYILLGIVTELKLHLLVINDLCCRVWFLVLLLEINMFYY
jgi:hypothetical protein